MVSLFLAELKDIWNLCLLIIIEMMNCVCIVPEDSKIICCRLKLCKALNCLIRVYNTLWVRVFWNTPDSLYRGIVIDIFLNHIHVRTILSHRDVYHLNSKLLCDCKMSVIARYRTEELHLVKLAPWCIAANTKDKCTCNLIIHDIET